MRLSRRELIEAYRSAPDSPLRQHIDALEDELRILGEVSNAHRVLAEHLQALVEKLRLELKSKPDVPMVVVQETEESHPMRLAALPLSLVAEEILQYGVEVELYDV
jgi:hypothetical protein